MTDSKKRRSQSFQEFAPVAGDAGGTPAQPPASAIGRCGAGGKSKSLLEQFRFYGSTLDERSAAAPLPEVGKPARVEYRFYESRYVPVSFAAKDWNVTPRRIRALLAAGRLAGRAQENGYWEVLFPYSFTFGTRGPGLKRQQKPKTRLRSVPDISERRAE